MNTLAFMICFAAWTMYGVLGAFLTDHGLLAIDKAQMGWLIGVPVLTGSILRLPVGLLTDRFGGKPMFIAIMLVSALGLVGTSFANGFTAFVVTGLIFGLSGTIFSAGVAYTSLWFPKERQGTALGIFGMGTIGSALTSMGAPILLTALTNNGAQPEEWRKLPLVYAGALVAVTIAFAFLTQNRKVVATQQKTWGVMLGPLRDLRVWRFGLYYFVVFGGFVALSQWLIPYYINVYGMSLAVAGVMASAFSLPSGITRALGGFVSDRFGARGTMYIVLSACTLLFLALVAPRMDITSTGEGILADKAGKVTAVSRESIVIGVKSYALKPAPSSIGEPQGNLVLPRFRSWQEPAVTAGQTVKKKELIARGITHVFFQANVWVFSGVVLLAGVMMGFGMAAVFRHIPDYFPNDVGVVGGLVGVIGGLGGFLCPILFGWMLKATGLWSSCWLFLALISVISLVWMHLVILKMGREQDQIRAAQAPGGQSNGSRTVDETPSASDNEAPDPALGQDATQPRMPVKL
ncbi:Nitrate/nitrite transporter [Fimbriimonas ginsengisoli Gsoil 348]|uniref:Nitrate/nitrite transporter n=1 Tax=Fimbriimonas ginsengisoli Gsoil 348 TaxID=661478 RepID=A0A068NV16_FIMGI|nr:Nitrate/nitrite transporter [Fimbriimonas ginsengisoli Gsoil 348]